MSKKWPPEIVHVEWVDSVAITTWQTYESKGSGLKDEDLEQTSVGFLVKKTKGWIALTHSVGIGLHNVCDTMQIPMCAVKKISYLKDKP